MQNVTNFYDDLDLKYPEIAIALQDIDRTNPGIVKFSIPVLTPNMDNSKATNQTVFQQDKTSLQNRDTKPEIENLTVSNYVEIEVPKELCAFVGGTFEVLESYSWPNAESKDSILHVRDAYITISPAHQQGSGSVVEGGSFSVSGSVSGNMDFKDGIPTGFLNLMPVDRYIKAGSKWIVVFIGGDITKPKIVARYS